jgi:hypothetical protein
MEFENHCGCRTIYYIDPEDPASKIEVLCAAKMFEGIGPDRFCEFDLSSQDCPWAQLRRGEINEGQFQRQLSQLRSRGAGN